MPKAVAERPSAEQPRRVPSTELLKLLLAATSSGICGRSANCRAAALSQRQYRREAQTDTSDHTGIVEDAERCCDPDPSDHRDPKRQHTTQRDR